MQPISKFVIISEMKDITIVAYLLGFLLSIIMTESYKDY